MSEIVLVWSICATWHFEILTILSLNEQCLSLIDDVPRHHNFKKWHVIIISDIIDGMLPNENVQIETNALSSSVHRYIVISAIKTHLVHLWIIEYDTWGICHWMGNLSEIMFSWSISATWRFWKFTYFDLFWLCLRSAPQLPRHPIFKNDTSSLVSGQLNVKYRMKMQYDFNTNFHRFCQHCMNFRFETTKAPDQCLPRNPDNFFSQSIYMYIMCIECDSNWWRHHLGQSKTVHICIQLAVNAMHVTFHHDYTFL